MDTKVSSLLICIKKKLNLIFPKECAALLVGFGSSLESADDEGQSPLHQAIAHPECVAFLLEKVIAD